MGIGNSSDASCQRSAQAKPLSRRNGDENHSSSAFGPLLRWRHYMSVAVDSTATNRGHSELNNAKVTLFAALLSPLLRRRLSWSNTQRQRWKQRTGSMNNLRTLIDGGASAIELMAVALIVGVFFWASVRFLLHTGRHAEDPYDRYKLLLGRTLSLGLEFLVAADVIRTVILPPTLMNIAVLAAVILTRTFLSWSLLVEMEGRWPWQPAATPPSRITAG